jgi:hypothetical protein
MTPEQLTRLSALLAKATLTGSENQELAFLKSIATPAELSQASGGDDAEDEEEEEEEAEEAPEGDDKDPKSAKPGLLDHAKALATPKSALVARNSELTAKIGKLTATNSQLSQTIAANATAIAELQTQVAALKGELAQANAENKTLSAKVSQELAGLGVKDTDLPGSASDENEIAPKAGMTDAEIEAALEKMPDLQARVDFLNKINAAKTAA